MKTSSQQDSRRAKLTRISMPPAGHKAGKKHTVVGIQRIWDISCQSLTIKLSGAACPRLLQRFVYARHGRELMG